MYQQQQPMGNPKPAVSKWLWITLIIVIVLAGAFFAWYYLMGPGKTSTATTTTTTTTPVKTDETADWKTYSNTKYLYSFKYPSTVTPYSFTGQGSNTAITNDADIVNVNKGAATERYIFEVSTEKTSSTVVLNDAYIKSHYKDGKATSAKVDGTDGFTLVVGSLTVYFVEKDGVIYQIQYSKSDTTATKIYSTFKFTTATASSTSTADWKTYTNSNLKVSFKYPTDWTIKEESDSIGQALQIVNLYNNTDQIKDAAGTQQPNVILGYFKDLSAIPVGDDFKASDFDASNITSANTVKVGTITGYWENLKDSATIALKNGNTGYFLTLDGAKTYSDASATIKTILSTFAFTQ